MTSVTRKTHMPSVEDSNCCSLSSKWCWSSGWCAAKMISLSANIHLLFLAGITVRRLRDQGLMLKVVGGRRSGRLLPFEAFRVPWILRSRGSFPPRPREVDHRYQISYGQNRCARSRHHIQDLKFRRVVRIAPRHSLVSKNELWKEC